MPAVTWVSTSDRVRWADCWQEEGCFQEDTENLQVVWKIHGRERGGYATESCTAKGEINMHHLPFSEKIMTLALDQGKVCLHLKARGSLSQ